jgi:hypothetical protein
MVKGVMAWLKIHEEAQPYVQKSEGPHGIDEKAELKKKKKKSKVKFILKGNRRINTEKSNKKYCCRIRF